MKAISNSSVCPSCGGGHKSKPFCVYENGHHCFSCGFTKTFDRGFSVVTNSNNTTTIKSLVELPSMSRVLTEFSLEAQEWLVKYNITQDVLNEYGIGYTDDNCLVFLNKQKNEIVGYQKRNMLKRFITTEGPKLPMLLAENISDSIILVEDYISAVRLTKHTNVLCLWGTKITYEKLLEVFIDYDNVLVWLDNDEEKEINSGQEAAKKIINIGEYIINTLSQRRGFSLNTKRVLNVITTEDPKFYTDTEIRQIIKDAAYVSK